MRNCCTAKLYNKFSYDAREIIKSDKFQEIFPGVLLQDDKQSLDGWSLTTAVQVSYFGAGVGGTIIGFGASLVAMTDDLFKSIDDALSETICDSTHSWYSGSHKSRMEKNCPAIDIGTRWTKKDVIGKNIQENYYDEVIRIPALDEKTDLSFCDDVKTTEEYREIRRTTDKGIWCAEYQQEPIESIGTLFSKSELKRFSLKALTEQLEHRDEHGKRTLRVKSKLGYIDVADTGKDRLSFPSAYIFKKKVYIVGFHFTDANAEVSKHTCAAEIKKFKHDYVRIESNNQGRVFAIMMRDLVSPEKILTITNSTNKHTRILMASGFIKEYFYFIEEAELEQGSEYDLAIEELCEYQKTGGNKHDDAPDALSGLAKFIQSFLSELFQWDASAVQQEPQE